MSPPRDQKIHVVEDEFSLRSSQPVRIGKFRVVRILGRGGFGVVYLAEDEQLRRPVALKVPLPGTLSNQQLRRQFLREAIAAAKLQHPNIVLLHEAIELEDSIHLSFAYCPGRTLQHWLHKQQGPIDRELAVEWVRKLAMAVEYSHRNGVIHRDIKPSNILLEEKQGWNGNLWDLEPKLTDFGLASVRDDVDGRTVTMNLMGTPQYMAPEQLIRSHDSGRPVDLYSLGVLLYQLLSGKVPAPFETMEQAIRQIDQFEPVALHVLRPEIPRNLSHIVMKCLEREPGRRYPSAQDLAEDLLNFQEGRPISIRAEGILAKLRRRIERHPTAFFLASAAALVVLIFLMDKVRNAIDLGNLRRQLVLREADLDQQTRKLESQNQSLSRSMELLSTKELELDQKSRRLLKSEHANDLVSAGFAYGRNDPVRMRQLLDRVFRKEKEELGAVCSSDFATRFLWESLRPEGQLVPTDPQSLWCMKATPDGKYMVVAGSRGILAIHSTVYPFEIVRRLAPQETEINSLDFDDAGSYLAAGCDDGRVRVWDFQQGNLLHSIELESKQIVYDVQWIPGSSRLLASGKSTDVYCIDAASGKLISKLATPHENSAIEFLSVIPDQKSFITGGSDGRICQLPLDGSSGHVVTWKPLSEVRCLAVTDHPLDHQTPLILYGDAAARLNLVDLQGRPLATLQFPDRFNNIEEISPNFFACGDNMGAIHLVKVIHQGGKSESFHLKIEQSWQQHHAPLYALGIVGASLASDHPERKLLFPTVFTGDRSGEMRVMGARNSNHRRFFTGIHGDAISQENSTWLRESDQKVIRALPRGIAVMDWQTGESEVDSCNDSNPGTWLAQGKLYPTHWVESHPDGTISIASEKATSASSEALFSNGQCGQAEFLDRTRGVIARGGDDWSFYWMDADTLLPKFRKKGVISMAVSPDERWIAVGERSANQVLIIDTKTLETIASLQLGRIAPDFLSITPDGQRLLIFGHLHFLSVWKADNWQHEQTIPLQSPLVLSHSVSSDSQTMAIGDSNGRVALWDLESGREILELRPEGGAIDWLEFTAEDQALVSTTIDGYMEVFHATPLERFRLEVAESLKRSPRVPHPIEFR
jgi:serine/threonine protein kinase/WD40 repeat protein